MKLQAGSLGGNPRSSLLLAIFSLGIWVCAGCAQTHPKPQVLYQRSGSPETYKRFERYPQRDFIHHFVREAYHPPRDEDFEGISDEQKSIVSEWGRPDYIRK